MKNTFVQLIVFDKLALIHLFLPCHFGIKILRCLLVLFSWLEIRNPFPVRFSLIRNAAAWPRTTATSPTLENSAGNPAASAPASRPPPPPPASTCSWTARCWPSPPATSTARPPSAGGPAACAAVWPLLCRSPATTRRPTVRSWPLPAAILRQHSVLDVLKNAIKLHIFSLLKWLLQGTVRSYWICMRVIPLDRPWKGHQPIQGSDFLFLILNI